MHNNDRQSRTELDAATCQVDASIMLKPKAKTIHGICYNKVSLPRAVDSCTSCARLSQSNELPPRLKHTILHIPPIQSALNCLATCHWASWHHGGSGGEWTWVGCQQLDQRPPGRRIGHPDSIDVLGRSQTISGVDNCAVGAVIFGRQSPVPEAQQQRVICGPPAYCCRSPCFGLGIPPWAK